jgi:hypothetical protein
MSWQYSLSYPVAAKLSVLQFPCHISRILFSPRDHGKAVIGSQTLKIPSTLKKIYPGFHGCDFINLDFYSILHYGDGSVMEKYEMTKCGLNHRNQNAESLKW